MSKQVELKIKLKSLAEESRIIRKEEKRIKKVSMAYRDKYALERLHLHRINVVRKHARETHLAYAYLKGYSYSEIERTAKTMPDWKSVEKMIIKYGDETQRGNFQSWPILKVESQAA